jgi:hypothetical protein
MHTVADNKAYAMHTVADKAHRGSDLCARSLVLDIQKEYSDEKAKAIDQRIFDLYGLTQEEREAIGYIDFHNNGEDTDDDE